MIFSNLRESIGKYIEKRKELHYINGYNYAAGELLRGTKTPVHLQSEQSEESDSFDYGVSDAILAAIVKGIVEDNRY